jgi:hypothetical protein
VVTSELTLYETDGNGIAVITVEPGMEYLVNAVRLEPVEVEPDSDGPEWRTLWASLTFEVPSPRSDARYGPIPERLAPRAMARYRNTV